MDVEVPPNARPRWPAARIRCALWCAQAALGALVVLAATGVGTSIEQRDTADEPRPVVLVETTPAPPAGVTDAAPVTASDGALAALGTLLVGWTVTAAAGTVGRRRLEDREAARWDAEWARVEPEWSGRVP